MQTTTVPNLKSIIAAISGNFVEWYDFALYLFLAPIIAKQFFPDNSQIALLGTFTVYAVSFFFRPLGAILFGHLGDVFGRKMALRLSISGLALLSIALAFLPNYNTIGLGATVMLCLCRIGQGICLGGEFAGSIIYIGEMSSQPKRSFCTSLTNNASNLGILAAAGSSALLSAWMSEENFAQYGYRLLFLLGGLAGLFGFTFRSDLKETQAFLEKPKTIKVPLLSVLKDHRASMLQLFLVVMISALGSYAFIGFMSTFLHQGLTLDLTQALRYETGFIALTLFLVPLFARYADKTSPKQMFKAACFSYMVLAIPCYYLLVTYQEPLFMLPLVVVYSMEQSCVPALLLDFFPAVRYTGVSTTYNTTMALVGGLSPLAGQWFVQMWDMPYGIALLLILGSTICLVALKMQQRSATLHLSTS